MFQQQVINQLARALNDRFYQPKLSALGVVSQMLVTRHHGGNTISSAEIRTLVYSDLEKVFPLPHLNIAVDEEENTASMNGHRFSTPENENSMRLVYRTMPQWTIVVKDETGGYQMVACADRYAIPVGELTVPFNYDEYKARFGSVEQDNFLVTSGQVIWVINSWDGVGKILTANGHDFPVSIGRRQKLGLQAPQIVCNDDQAKTFAAEPNWLHAFGIETDEDYLTLFDLVKRLAAVEAAAVDDTPADPERKEMFDKVLAAFDIESILEEIIKLPKNKRTKNSIRDHIVRIVLEKHNSK